MVRYSVLVALAVLCLASPLFADELPDPSKPGSFPVGVTTMLLVDQARMDVLTNQPRTLPTEIWYPAADETRGLPTNRLSDFLGKRLDPGFVALLQAAFGIDLAAADKSFVCASVRDARPRDGVFPLVVFSHGNGGLRFQNSFWCEHMASHGYIVMAPDHTTNCAVTFIDGNIVPMMDAKEAREQSSKDRPKDVSFLIDVMTRFNKGADSRFTGRVDLERIGVAGHSFGGYTCGWVADQDPRVDAICPMTGAPKDRTNFTCPVMLFLAGEDATLGLEGNANIRKYYDDSKGPKYFLELPNAGHFSFTEMYQLKPDFGDGVGSGTRITNAQPIDYIKKDVIWPLINGYSTAFFGKFLKGQDGHDSYLAENHCPAEVILKAEPAAE